MKPVAVIKRDGLTVPFEATRIAGAIARALHAVRVRDDGLSVELAQVVEEHIARVAERPEVGLEEVQDAVVHVLQESGHYEVAITYARYRDARERARRERRARGERQIPVHLTVVDTDGRSKSWNAEWFLERLGRRYDLHGAPALDVLAGVEDQLAPSPATCLSTAMADALAEAAMIRLGLTATVTERGDLRIPREDLIAAATASDGQAALLAAGRAAFRQEAATGGLTGEVARMWSRGRLWIDGLDDPMRGSQYTVVIEAGGNPWQVIAQAAAAVIDGGRSWRRVRVILPPSILGHLERGAAQLAAPLESLGNIAQVFLYCDGRTPLLESWPFPGARVGLATYSEDFLLSRQLAERGLSLISGIHFARGGWRHRVAVEAAINAQGLEHAWSQLDLLAMGLATAAKHRLARQPRAMTEGAELNFAIYGLASASTSADYLERQVVQEGQRQGLTFTRATNLTAEACAHLGRLLDG